MEDQEQEENKMDVITVDVPLFIRLLEFAREDATDDMMLHDVAEKLIEMCADGDIMTMEQYDEIVGSQENGADTSGMNAVEDNMHNQNKDMNTINEQRWLKLAGINENEVKQLNEDEAISPSNEELTADDIPDDQFNMFGAFKPNPEKLLRLVLNKKISEEEAKEAMKKYGFTLFDILKAGWKVAKSGRM